MIFHISPLLSMGPFLWAWHPISTAALVQCPPIAGNGFLLDFLYARVRKCLFFCSVGTYHKFVQLSYYMKIAIATGKIN